MPRYVDLSHTIEDGMPTYPGLLPPVRVEALMEHEASRERYQGKAEFFLGRIDMPMNTPTYLDTPFHRFPDGADASAIPLERVAGLDALVVDAGEEARATEIQLPEDELRGRAVLVRTGWDRRWGSEAYWEPDPWLSAGTVERLVAAGAALVGVDFKNVDDTNDPARPAHTGLLGGGVLIVEQLRGLDALPRDGFRFFAAPLRVVRGAAMPVRAFAELAE